MMAFRRCFFYFILVLLFGCANRNESTSKTQVFHYYLSQSFPNQEIFQDDQDYAVFLVPEMSCNYCQKTAFQIIDTVSSKNVVLFTNIQKDNLPIEYNPQIYIDSLNIELMSSLNFGIKKGAYFLKYNSSIKQMVSAESQNLDSIAGVLKAF